MDDWEEEASVAMLGSSFSLGSGAATATANAEQAQSRGRNDSRSMGAHSRADHGVVGQPRAGITNGSASGGGDRTRASGGGGAVIHSNQDRLPV